MTLYDHLGTKKNIRLPVGKTVQYLFIAVFCPCAVRIHPKNPCPRELSVNRLFDLLRSRTETKNIFGTAFRAASGSRPGVTAVMAYQLPARMFRKRHITMGAFHHISARTAGNKSGISPPVQKQDALFPLCQPFLQQFPQLSAENRTVSLSQLFPQIYRPNRRQLLSRLPLL